MSTEEAAKGEQKTERFNMFMSPSEMQAIDEWAWKHRIRSKSEAVRRLCQIAIHLEPMIDDLIHRWGDVQSADDKIHSSILAGMSSRSDTGIEDMSKVYDDYKRLGLANVELLIHANEMEAVRDALRSGKDVEESIENLNQRMMAMKKADDQYREALRASTEEEDK